MKKVVVVGSSDNILWYPHGQTIDRYDIIVRMNRAPTKGYEAYTGSRTTHRFMNPHALRNKRIAGKRFKDEDFNFVPNIRNECICASRDKTMETSKFYTIYHESCTKLNIPSRRDILARALSEIDVLSDMTVQQFGRGISVGLSAILYFLTNGMPPTIHGFHIHDLNRHVAPHYWKHKISVGNYHDFSVERRCILRLIDSNIIKTLYLPVEPLNYNI